MDECQRIAIAAIHRERAAIALFDLTLSVNSSRFKLSRKAFTQTLAHAISHREAADAFAPIPKELVS